MSDLQLKIEIVQLSRNVGKSQHVALRAAVITERTISVIAVNAAASICFQFFGGGETEAMLLKKPD